ncbi:hypothetical protein PR202_ga30091 [Eleusine coracana subsp. coracana]|uniref:DUF659 domain-containing protein n=1 Tax=Eleusine coracana subsp. coracana TaxID=191504 RepID=A0AAV5DMH8_ELECO|nr:hypothetical protein PR202_ga30091 [Eleusine coracana subsp. coracana]
MASPASVNDEYDPRTGPRRKAKSKDPSWRYGYWPNLENRDEVICILCDTKVSGCIKRLKQHLAGGYVDAKMCEKTTTEIRKEMEEYLEKNKRCRPLFLDGDDDVVEVVVGGTTNAVEDLADRVETQASIMHPSSGTSAKQRRVAFQFKAKPTAKPATKSKANKLVIEMIRKTPEEIVDERRSKSSQPTIVANTKTKEQKEYVDMQWALWFYECGIAFKAAAARQFQIALEATTQYGSSPEGTYFLESIDASSEVRDAQMLADLLEKRIEDIGKDKIVQVVTDNGANFKAVVPISRQLVSF